MLRDIRVLRHSTSSFTVADATQSTVESVNITPARASSGAPATSRTRETQRGVGFACPWALEPVSARAEHRRRQRRLFSSQDSAERGFCGGQACIEHVSVP